MARLPRANGFRAKAEGYPVGGKEGAMYISSGLIVLILIIIILILIF
jgi:hypothetical protein